MLENPYQSPQAHSALDAANAHRALTTDGRKPRIWTVFAVLGTVFAGIVAVSVILGIVAVVFLAPSSDSLEELDAEIAAVLESPLGCGIAVTVGQLPLLIVPLVAAWLSPVPLRRRLGLVPSGLTGLQFAVVAAGVAAPFALGLAAKQSLDGVIGSDQTLQRAFGNVTWPTLLPFVAVVAILPAFAVEILVRGYVQRRLLERWPPWMAIVFSSVGYMLVHMDVSNALFSLPPAIWFGWIAWKTNSVWPSIGSHMLGLVAWGLTAGLMGLTGNETLPMWFNLVAVGVGLAITGWAVRIVLAQEGRAATAVVIVD